ncbi:sigma factor-like helix-turn-helix DNA-binding protein [Streptomyces sp. NPDC054956]
MTAPARPVVSLTPEQIAVLELVAQGYTLERAGKALGVSRNAVKLRLHRASAQLGAENSTHAVFLACLAGILDGRRQHHGDHNGYEAHIRRRDKICDPCRDGEKAYRAALKARQTPQEAA